MEPLFFKAENLIEWRVAKQLEQEDFNGAAFFQSGKCLVRFPVVLVDRTSMEPLFFKAENRSLRSRDCNGLSLQWSRFFSKRKILLCSKTMRPE